jgi:hypothetical protein
MSAPNRADRETGTGRTACYVYGVVPADVEAEPDARGVGDPPARVDVVAHGEIAALLSEIDPDAPLGRPEHLQAHERLLDAAATEVPVLPFRFGAVLTDRDAVAEELLAAHHDDFVAALRELEGRAEYVVKGRYLEDAVIREVLAENPELGRLRERIHGRPEEATRNERITLGEAVNRAVVAKRDADTRRVVDTLGPLCVAVRFREPTHEEDAVHVAVLAETGRQAEIEDALRRLAGEWSQRVTLRLLGPMAPYDFVTTRSPGG